MYGKGIAHFYDFFAPDSNESAKECAFIQRIARANISVNNSVLDIGAGVGSTAFAMAAAGFDVTALEPDAGMFAVLMSRLALRPDLQGTLSPIPRAAGFDLGEKFDICLCAYTLHLIPPIKHAALFSFASAHLVPGGIFILAAPVDSSARVKRERVLEGERTFGEVTFQYFSALAKTGDHGWRTTWEFVTTRAGKVVDRVVQEFNWQTKSASEIRRYAVTAGLTVAQQYSDFVEAPFVDGKSRAVVLVARL